MDFASVSFLRTLSFNYWPYA